MEINKRLIDEFTQSKFQDLIMLMNGNIDYLYEILKLLPADFTVDLYYRNGYSNIKYYEINKYNLGINFNMHNVEGSIILHSYNNISKFELHDEDVVKHTKFYTFLSDNFSGWDKIDDEYIVKIKDLIKTGNIELAETIYTSLVVEAKSKLSDEELYGAVEYVPTPHSYYSNHRNDNYSHYPYPTSIKNSQSNII